MQSRQEASCAIWNLCEASIFCISWFHFFYTTKERLCSIEDDCLLKFYQGAENTTLSFPLWVRALKKKARPPRFVEPSMSNIWKCATNTWFSTLLHVKMDVQHRFFPTEIKLKLLVGGPNGPTLNKYEESLQQNINGRWNMGNEKWDFLFY